MNADKDQETLVRKVRNLLTMAKKEETLALTDRAGGNERLERSDQLRREAEELGRASPTDVMNELFREYASGNVVR